MLNLKDQHGAPDGIMIQASHASIFGPKVWRCHIEDLKDLLGALMDPGPCPFLECKEYSRNPGFWLAELSHSH